MKTPKIKSLQKLLLIALIALIGCSKDESNNSLIGHWVGVSFTTSIAIDENGDGLKNTDLTKEMDCVSMEAEFTSAGNFSVVSTDVTYEISFVDGKVVLTPTGCGSYTEIGEWTLNEAGSNLTLAFTIEGKDEPTIVDVQIDLNSDALVMKDLLYNEDSVRITYAVEFRKL